MPTYTTHVNGGSIEIVVPDDNADGTEYSNLNQTNDEQIQVYSNTLDLVTLIKNIDSITIQDDGNGGITLSSTDNVYEPSVTSETDTVTPIVNETDTTDSLLDLVRKDSQSKTSANKASLIAYENRTKLIEEQNKILAEQNKTFKELIQTVAISNASVVKQIEQLSNNIDIANGLKTGDLILKADNNRILSQKDMSTTVNTSVEAPTVNTTVESPNVTNVIDTSSIANETAKIATATESIAKASDSQIETNTKINEKLDFEKNGLSTLKGSDDSAISPRVAKAIKDYELGLQTKDMNVTDISEFMEYIETGLDVLDSAADSLGIEDGITLDFNPIEAVVQALKDLTSEELQKEGNLKNE